MEAWQKRFASKVTSASEAVRSIEPGRRILIGSGAAEPQELVKALCDPSISFCDNEIVHLLTLGPAPYVEPSQAGRFRHKAFFIGENVRRAVQEGRADFVPVFLSEIPRLIETGRTHVDAALVQVSPPDQHGFVSLGVSVDIVRSAVDHSDLVIAEVNPRMPRTHGSSFVHVDQIRWLVPVDYELPERSPRPADEVDRQIAKHVARLIPDGATLQMGIGRIPDAVLSALSDHKDLGVHTEMFSDGVMRLAEAGVINGRRKNKVRGKIVSSFVMGTRSLYRWVHDNPAVELLPSQITNDPYIIAKQNNMVAINSAIEVDLTGQVTADSIKGRFFSGIGGQVDFLRGAARSKGGRPIIAMPSTAKGNTVSRIRPVLEEGAGVVTSRGDVHYVVTEYGVANLWGKSIRERALALIEVAHPDFRAELLSAAKARHYVLVKDAAVVSGPQHKTSVINLVSGDRVTIRPAGQSDQTTLHDFAVHLGEADPTHGADVPAHVARWIDPQREGVTFVALSDDEASEEVLGVASMSEDKATRLGHAEVIVQPSWQGFGLGKALLGRLLDAAKQRGLLGLEGKILPDNARMMALVYRSGASIEVHRDTHGHRVRLLFAAPKTQDQG